MNKTSSWEVKASRRLRNYFLCGGEDWKFLFVYSIWSEKVGSIIHYFAIWLLKSLCLLQMNSENQILWNRDSQQSKTGIKIIFLAFLIVSLLQKLPIIRYAFVKSMESNLKHWIVANWCFVMISHMINSKINFVHATSF